MFSWVSAGGTENEIIDELQDGNANRFLRLQRPAEYLPSLDGRPFRQRHRALDSCLSMIFSAGRFTCCAIAILRIGIML
jgi:hypothetical protein